MTKIFYQYDINLEDNNGLDFSNLPKNLLVLVKCRKYLADFIKDKKIDLINKYESLKKLLITSKILSFL